MFIILNIFLIICSLIFWPFKANDSFWVIKEAVFVFGCLAILSYNYYRGRNINNMNNIFISLLLLYVSVGFVWFFYSAFINANGKVIWNFWNMRPTINLILGLLLIKVLFENTDSIKIWIDTGKVIAWLGGLFAVYAMLQYFGIDQIFNNPNVKFLFENNNATGDQKMVTFFGSPFVTSGFLTICSPMCLIFKGKLYRIFYLLIFIALVLLNKSMALGAFGLSLVLYLVMNKKFVKLGFLISGFLLFFLFKYFSNPDFFSLTGRYEIWVAIWNKFLEAPFFGRGLGYFEMLKLKSGNLDVFFAHNEYLHNLIDIGIVGSIFYILFFIDLGKKIFYVERNILLIGYTCGLVSLLVLSFGSFPMRIAPLALIAIIYISGLLYQCKGVGNG